MMTAAEWQNTHPLYMAKNNNFAKALTNYEIVQKAHRITHASMKRNYAPDIFDDYDKLVHALDQVEVAIHSVKKIGKTKKLFDDLTRCVKDVKEEKRLHKSRVEAYLRRYIYVIRKDLAEARYLNDAKIAKAEQFMYYFRGKLGKPVRLEKDGKVIRGYYGIPGNKVLLYYIGLAKQAYLNDNPRGGIRAGNYKRFDAIKDLSSNMVKARIKIDWPNVLSDVEKLPLIIQELEDQIETINVGRREVLADLNEFSKFTEFELLNMPFNAPPGADT